MLCNGVNIQHGLLNQYQPGCRVVSCAINFCPMCGRPISDDERVIKDISKEIDILNRLITTSETDFVIKNSQQTEVQDQTTSLGNSTKCIKKNLHIPFSNYSKKVKQSSVEANKMTQFLARSF